MYTTACWVHTYCSEGYLQCTVIGPSWPNCSLVLWTWPIKSMKPSPVFGTPCSGQSVNWNCLMVLDWPSYMGGHIIYLLLLQFNTARIMQMHKVVVCSTAVNTRPRSSYSIIQMYIRQTAVDVREYKLLNINSCLAIAIACCQRTKFECNHDNILVYP